MVEEVDLWRRNPLDCIQELIGNPLFKDNIVFEPGQFFTDEACSNRLIDEAWTANWWWKAHVSSRLSSNDELKKHKRTRKKYQRAEQ